MREPRMICWTLFIAIVFPQMAAIAQWTNGQPADVVLGQESFTTSFNSIAPTASAIYSPQGIAVDSVTGKVFVADASNHRVLRWSSMTALQNGAQAEAVLGQPDFVSRTAVTSQSGMSSPQGLAADNNGRLWVADRGNNRILRFDNAATKPSGANADGVLGQPDFNSAGLITTQNGMWAPAAVAVDMAGCLWVADETNNRVLRFDNAASKVNGANADGVLGQPDFTRRNLMTTQNGMIAPTGVAIDNGERLWVADRTNHRVLRFDNAAAKSNGANADGVLGQPDFTSRISATTQSGMNLPISVAVDSDNHLFVSERSNNRVLRFDNAAAKPNGANADGVLGQPGFDTNTPTLIAHEISGTPSSPLMAMLPNRFPLLENASKAIVGFEQLNVAAGLEIQTANRLSSPAYLALDQGRLWVTDNGNRRVLRFDNAAVKPNGADADGVLGQPDFVTMTPIISASTLFAPAGVAFDPQTGKLFVADAGNNRILRWSSINAGISGSLPEAVFGQPDFTSNLRNRGTEPAANTHASPYGLAIDDAGRLWVVDSRNARILRFDNAATKPSGANADGVLGQPDFTTVSTAGDSIPTQSNLSSQVVGIAVDNAGNLYVADGNRINICRVLRWNNAADKPNGAPADGVLGQADFTSASPYRGGTRPTANNLRAGFGVAVDQEGTLYVADLVRVLRFDNAATKPNGVDADGVLGQPDFVSDFGIFGSGGNALTQDRMNGPFSMGVDGEGNLYVGDIFNRRTLVFLRAKTKPNGAPADFVLGQPDFSSNRDEVSQSIAAAPSQIAIDNANGAIWLALGAFSLNNQNRVLRFKASRPLSVKLVDSELPKSFALSQNYPNPFNPTTRFDFSIPSSQKVSLKIYDLHGQEVATLINEHKTAGTYNVTFDANGMSTGIYFYRLRAASFIETKKMILAK